MIPAFASFLPLFPFFLILEIAIILNTRPTNPSNTGLKIKDKLLIRKSWIPHDRIDAKEDENPTIEAISYGFLIAIVESFFETKSVFSARIESNFE